MRGGIIAPVCQFITGLCQFVRRCRLCRLGQFHRLLRLSNPRIKLFETFGTSVEALKAGDVDTVLTDMTAGQGYVAASEGKLKLVGEPLGTEDFGFIFPKGSDLEAPLNAAIAALKADGTLEALNKKWFLDYKMN